MALVDVTTEVVINCKIDKVADYAANPDSAPLWYENIESVEWKTQPPLSLGSQITFTANFMGKKLKYTYEGVEYNPNNKLVMKTAEGPFPMETTYEWETVEESKTRMRLRNRGRPRGFSALMTPLMAKMMRKANSKDLDLIKNLLEE